MFCMSAAFVHAVLTAADSPMQTDGTQPYFQLADPMT